MYERSLFTISEFVLDEKFPKEILEFIIFGKHQVKMLVKSNIKLSRIKTTPPK